MTIKLLQAILIAGVHTPVDGATLSLTPAMEASLVEQGKATWVTAPTQTDLNSPADLDKHAHAHETLGTVSVKTNSVTGGVKDFMVAGTALGMSIPGNAKATAEKDIRGFDNGTFLTNWANATFPDGGASAKVTSDLAPVKDSQGYAVQLVGDASIRAKAVSIFTAKATGVGFTGIMFWCKGKGRTTPSPVQLYLGNGDDPYTGKALATTFAVPSDGKWHKVFLPKGVLQSINSFVVGTDTIQSIGLGDRHLVGLSLGYPGMLDSSQEMRLGPVYINPFGRAKFLIRMDDSMVDQLVANPAITFTADGVTQAWSHHSLMEKYGFGSKGSCFHLSRRFNTSNRISSFLTDSQLATLAGYGWSHCTQTHQDPFDSANKGVMLMGPSGYADRTVSAVANATNTLTSAAHKIPVGTALGYGGYPIIFNGTDLPAPLIAGQVYWARGTTVDDFRVYTTEARSIGTAGQTDADVIDLTSDGSGTITYKYAYSANDYTLVQQDIQNCIAILDGLGYSNTSRIWAPNQGACDVAALVAAKAAGVEMILSIGNVGAAFDSPYVRFPHAETVGATSGNQALSPQITVPNAFQTDGSPTAANARTYVRAVMAAGGIGSNYHHAITAANGVVLAAYLDELRAGVAEGGCDVVTAEELRDYLAAVRSMIPGVIL